MVGVTNQSKGGNGISAGSEIGASCYVRLLKLPKLSLDTEEQWLNLFKSLGMSMMPNRVSYNALCAHNCNKTKPRLFHFSILKPQTTSNPVKLKKIYSLPVTAEVWQGFDASTCRCIDLLLLAHFCQQKVFFLCQV